MTSLHLDLQCCAPASGSFLSWCIFFHGSDVSFPTPIPGLFNALGKASPVCALLPQLDSLETFYCIYYWPVGKSKVSVWQKWINTRCCATGCTPHKWCRILSLPACGKKSWWLLPGWHNSKHLHKEEYSTSILTSWSFLSAL